MKRAMLAAALAVASCRHGTDSVTYPEQCASRGGLVLDRVENATGEESGRVGLRHHHSDESAESVSCRRPANAQEQCEVEAATAMLDERRRLDDTGDEAERWYRTIYARAYRDCQRRMAPAVEVNGPPGSAQQAP